MEKRWKTKLTSAHAPFRWGAVKFGAAECDYFQRALKTEALHLTSVSNDKVQSFQKSYRGIRRSGKPIMLPLLLFVIYLHFRHHSCFWRAACHPSPASSELPGEIITSPSPRFRWIHVTSAAPGSAHAALRRLWYRRTLVSVNFSDRWLLLVVQISAWTTEA